ncbi:MAG: hypothetical protein HY084_11880 [Gemmatimonadetes bacterium]|nr:hypothetical protein [Gemmatimonadota bacterium]
MTLAVRRWFRVATQSGSVYHVVETTCGEFFARVDSVPNPFSVAISPARWWRIQPAVPWPPQIGQSLALVARAELPLDHAERMPGGGKVTSVVLAIEEATWT